jgi:hypothetical protein
MLPATVTAGKSAPVAPAVANWKFSPKYQFCPGVPMTAIEVSTTPKSDRVCELRVRVIEHVLFAGTWLPNVQPGTDPLAGVVAVKSVLSLKTT